MAQLESKSQMYLAIWTCNLSQPRRWLTYWLRHADRRAARQLAEQYGDDVASDVLSRSRNKIASLNGGTAPPSPMTLSFSQPFRNLKPERLAWTPAAVDTPNRNQDMAILLHRIPSRHLPRPAARRRLADLATIIGGTAITQHTEARRRYSTLPTIHETTHSQHRHRIEHSGTYESPNEHTSATHECA